MEENEKLKARVRELESRVKDGNKRINEKPVSLVAREIIDNIARDREYKQICKNIGGAYGEDLFQELIIILLEYNPAKIEEIYSKGQIKWFIIGILKKQFHSDTSNFYRKNKEFTDRATNLVTDILGDEIKEPEDEEDIKIEFLEEALKSENCTNYEWYERELLKAVIREGGVTKLARKTKIYRKSISYTLNKFKEKLKFEYEEYKKQKQWKKFLESQGYL